MGTAQVRVLWIRRIKTLQFSVNDNARCWHDEAYLYINQAITQVRPKVGHEIIFTSNFTSGEAEHRQEGCGSDDVSAGSWITGPGAVRRYGGDAKKTKNI